jgi:hypothetical protein
MHFYKESHSVRPSERFDCGQAAVDISRLKKHRGAMETCRREFLQKMSGVAALAASPSILGQVEVTAIPQTLSLVGQQESQNMASLRAQFPVLAERVNGKPLVYLDNAATFAGL